MSAVLLIDDEPWELATLEAMLDDEDYRLETAASGQEARRIIRDHGHEIDAVLLDPQLPHCDGLELLRWIKQQPPMMDTEVIVESAEIVADDIQAGLDCGAYYYITKPYEENQLRAIVRAALETGALRRSLATQVRQTQDTCRLLHDGTFHLKTVAEAELLAVHLSAACGDEGVELGLHELLLNAIEHGNLGLTYEEKNELRELGLLEEERRRRLALPQYRDKRVTLKLVRREAEMLVVIRDCGPGFDYERYLRADTKRLLDSNGRGILLANALLDLTYVHPGNCVRVVLPLARLDGALESSGN